MDDIIITYPSRFEQKIMRNEVTNTNAVNIELTVPSLVNIGQKFALKIAIFDAQGYVVDNFAETLEVANVKVKFTKESPAVAQINGLSLNQEGIIRFETIWNNQVFYSNPIWCKEQHVNNIYWGDPHIHTNLSNCNAVKCRSLNFAYTAAKYGSALDWIGVADHVSNNRCNYAVWKEQVAVAELFNDSDFFVTLPAFEASFKGGKGGDNNFYLAKFPEIFVDDYDNGNIKTAVAKMAEIISPDDFFVVPHHTSRKEKHGEISREIHPNDEMMPLMEIHSKWGTSEYRGNDMALFETHDGPSYAQDLLALGYKMGFIGGTDTHATMTTAKEKSPQLFAPAGMTAVFAEDLTRNGIFRALKQRNCYAVCKDRIILAGTVNGAKIGSSLQASEVNIELQIAAKAEIENIILICNGVEKQRVHPQDWQAKFLFHETIDFSSNTTNYYYVRIECKNGAKAWTNPTWISCN